MEKERDVFLLTECVITTMTVESGRMSLRKDAMLMSAKRITVVVPSSVWILLLDISVAARKDTSCQATHPVLVSRNI